MHHQMLPKNDPDPLWSSMFLLAFFRAFDAKARPALGALAMISAVLCAAGLLSHLPDPGLFDFLL